MMRITNVHRAEDGVRLGSFTAHQGGFLAVRVSACDPKAPWFDGRQLSSNQPSIDAARTWIQANPFLLPPTCPETHGVFGPVLATWGNIRVLGCAYHTRTADFDQSLTEDTPHPQPWLVAMDRDGFVQAKIFQNISPWHEWNVMVAGPFGPYHRGREHWADALDLFKAEIIKRFCAGSMHLRLQVQAESASLDEAATRFGDQRHLLRQSVFLDPPDTTAAS